MKTARRKCIKEFSVSDDEGNSFELEVGRTYSTSLVAEAPVLNGIPPRRNRVVVFSKYWVSVPIACFEPISITS